MRQTLLVALLVGTVGCGVRLPGQPIKPPDPTPAERAAAQYATNCSGCHGEDGRYGPAPPIHDPLFLALIPDEELVKVILNGRPGTPMPGFAKANGGPFDEAEAGELARQLKARWGDPKQKTAGVPTYLDPGGGDVEAGRAVWAKACANCHGADGKGNTSGAIHEQAFLGLTTNQALRRLIITGRPDLGMPDYADRKGRNEKFQPLTQVEVTNLTAYLASWRHSLGDK